MTGGELNGTQIHALLQELGRRLQARGIHGDVKLVGGAALILQGIGNRPTADIDASYADQAAVNAVVTDMAVDYDLALDWLNSNAAAFVPDNATWVELEQLDGLTIQAADTETLLAMKIAAERDKDTLDIARLLRKLNITNANDAVDLAYDKYGHHSIPLAARTTSSSSTTLSTQPQPSNLTTDPTPFGAVGAKNETPHSWQPKASRAPGAHRSVTADKGQATGEPLPAPGVNAHLTAHGLCRRDIYHPFAKHVRKTARVMSPRRPAMNSEQSTRSSNLSPAFSQVMQFRTLPSMNK